MSRVDVVRAAMVEAMKAKDKARKDSLSMLLSALKNAEIDKRSPLTEEEADAVVKKRSSRRRRLWNWLRQIVRISARRHRRVWQFIRNLHRRI